MKDPIRIRFGRQASVIRHLASVIFHKRSDTCVTLREGTAAPMAIEITIPRLGWSMEEGTFAGWLKRDGEPVRAGDPLFSLEGEKATQDVEAIDDGTLKIPTTGPNAGDVVAVGAVIGYLLGVGESDAPGPSRPAEAGPETVRATVPPQPSRADRPAPAGSDRDRPRSSPLARRLAKEHGIDWTRLRGSGRTGRIRRDDVLEAVRARDDQATPTDPRSVPVSPARRAIAARMVESRNTTAPVTLTTTLDATNLVGLRRQFRAADDQGEGVPSFTDFVVKLTALALRDHPMLHARWVGVEDRIVVPDEAHVGIAVDTEAGLFVPVIRGAAGLGLREIAARSRDLIRRARARQLRPGDTEGGTFTVTNLGPFGVEAFTPIIKPPECAILGMGRIARQPVLAGGKVVGRERMSLSLTFDHRTVDGAPAARFLQQVVRLIENPAPWLLH